MNRLRTSYLIKDESSNSQHLLVAKVSQSEIGPQLAALNQSDSSSDESVEAKKQAKYVNLGSSYNCCQKVTNLLQQPKLYTPHYNVNGQNIYTSNVTIIIFTLMIFYLFFLSTYEIFPVLSSFVLPDLYQSTIFTREQLTNPLGLAPNVTEHDSNSYINFWYDYIVSKKY